MAQQCILLLLLAACCCFAAATAVQVIPTELTPKSRTLLVNTLPPPNTPPVTVPVDPTLVDNSTDVGPNDPRVAKKGLGCDTPNQVHLSYWSPTSVLVSWVTCDALTGPSVNSPQPTPGPTSLLYWPAHCHKAKAATAGAHDSQQQQQGQQQQEQQGQQQQGKEQQQQEQQEEEEELFLQEEEGDAFESDAAAAAAAEPSKAKSKRGPGCKVMKASGVTTAYFMNYTEVLPSLNYASGVIHHVLIKDLVPGQTYKYKVSGVKNSRKFTFRAPAQTFPLRLGVVGDPGQTHNSTVVLDRLVQEAPDMMAILGDLNYADDWLNWTTLGNSSEKWSSFGPKWDTWSNLYEPLLSKVPNFHVAGNHEILREGGTSLTTGNETARMRAYNHRFPMPQTAEQRQNGPTAFKPATASDPWPNLYWASEVPGVFKVIGLTSYSPGQNFTTQEQQYVWLQAELARTDRTRTPWLLVIFHAPWYSSYVAEYKGNEAMRATYEPLLVQHKVDIILNGHVHSYERKTPINNNTVDTAGPVSITLGDGGNIEGLRYEFVDQPTYSSTWNSTCLDNGADFKFPWYQPSPPGFKFYEPSGEWCPGGVPGCWCYGTQPSWSAFREPSFGYGVLTFESATESTWTWHKNEAPAFQISDQVRIIRTP